MKQRKFERAPENCIVMHCQGPAAVEWHASLYTRVCAHTHPHSYVARDLLHLCFRDMATLFGTSCFPSPTTERTEGREGKEGKGGGALGSDIHHTLAVSPWLAPGLVPC